MLSSFLSPLDLLVFGEGIDGETLAAAPGAPDLSSFYPLLIGYTYQIEHSIAFRG